MLNIEVDLLYHNLGKRLLNCERRYTTCEEEAARGSNWASGAGGGYSAICGSSTCGSCSSDFITVCLPKESSGLCTDSRAGISRTYC